MINLIWDFIFHNPIIAFLTAVFIFAALYYVVFKINIRQDAAQEKKVAQVEQAIKAEPEKAKPAWDLARLTLDNYFKRNLSQINSIFWISLFIMIAGFGFSIWAIYQAVQNPDILAPAAIATLIGLITEFIGATFLFVYRSTVQQALVYMKSLERINSVGMAMQILDTMPKAAKPDDLKTLTKAKLVDYLMRQSITNNSEPQPSDAQNNG